VDPGVLAADTLAGPHFAMGWYRKRYKSGTFQQIQGTMYIKADDLHIYRDFYPEGKILIPKSGITLELI